MSETTPVRKPIYGLLLSDLEGLDPLTELGLDISWPWPHATEDGRERRGIEKTDTGQAHRAQAAYRQARRRCSGGTKLEVGSDQ